MSKLRECLTKCCHNKPQAIFCLVMLGILLLSLYPITVTTVDAAIDAIKGTPEGNPTAELVALAPHTPPTGWPEAGVFGTYDRASLQRGFQVYKEVCSTCHSMKLLSYRNLADLGFSVAEVKAIAAGYQVADQDNDSKTRPGKPSDNFVSPFPNDQAARAAMGGALPPDLSLIIKARKGHEDYVYSILTGFGQTPPTEEKIAAGMNYNPYFAGHQIAMPQPLHDGAVTYADGTNATTDQMSQDVVQFLAWASEPKMEMRKQMGIRVILFLIVFACVMYGVKRRIWKKLH